jgi:hypothetical protein
MGLLLSNIGVLMEKYNKKLIVCQYLLYKRILGRQRKKGDAFQRKVSDIGG